MFEIDNITFEQCAKDEAGKIYADWIDGEFRCMVMRGPGSICAYIGVKEDHPLYGKDYDDLSIDCHGGLTFADKGDDVWRPAGWWYFGWDYGHYMDAAFYDLEYNRIGYDEHRWTPAEVKAEVGWVIIQFEKLTRLLRVMK